MDSKKRKQEIAFAGLNATARDFAKLGQLYLKEGKWNGKQLINPSWIKEVTEAGKGLPYKNQWWLNGTPHATGILNQYIYFYPASKTVIVRLGRFWKHPSKRPESFIHELGRRL